MKVHIVFEKGCINYTGVESVNYFQSMGCIVLGLRNDYTKEQYRYESSQEDPIHIYNHSITPFKHTFLMEEVEKICVE